ncbi:MAG: uroporphyrinogen-III synthase [Proteobacteria bacterium]|nr:uroporphyrinogen-III synthase [Pseudomonadota bacterium]
MRVLVTRPRPDADDTASALIALGHDPVVAPLLRVTFETDADLDLSDVQAILITSANGARALASATERRDLPVFAVGDASANAARQCGFAQTESAGGNVEKLAALVTDRLSPRDGPLVHVAGTVTAGDLSGTLTKAGFEVSRAVLYRAETVPRLPPVIAAHLRDGTLDAALFYSPRTAAQFAALVAAEGLERQCGRIIAFALSAAVAEKLSALPFSLVRNAKSADQASLLDALNAAST